MNVKDRKQIDEITKALGALLAQREEMDERCRELGGQLRDLADAEQEKFDNLSEGLQQGERGAEFEQAAQALGAAADACEGEPAELADAINELENNLP